MTHKNVVITGASVGIGAATARRFAQEGHTLVLMARRKDKLDMLRKELLPHKVLVVVLDLSKQAGVEEALHQVEKELGTIDVLINNAGNAFSLDKAHEADLEDWEKCINININGLLYCTHAVLPGMVKRNQGHIINIGSTGGLYPYPGGNVYGSTKAFVHQFSLCLRTDLIGTAVRVSCIEPGIVGETEFSLVRFKGDASKAKAVYTHTQPLKPEDIAEIIYFSTALPPHVNINTLEVMPTAQSWAGFSVHRTHE